MERNWIRLRNVIKMREPVQIQLEEKRRNKEQTKS